MVQKDCEKKKGIVFGMCNPLLDIISHVDEEFLNKYQLLKDNAILAEDYHLPLYDEIFDKNNTEFAPGGSVQNTFKILQWITQIPFISTFMGSIGQDKYGKIMENKMFNHGINTIYQLQEEENTGTCAVLIDDDKRSLCANLGAAKRFSRKHLLDNLKVVHQANYYYISGYFLAVCPDSILQVAEHSLAQGKTFMMNISALYICSVFHDPLMKVFPYVDIIFGNDMEMREFAKVNKFEQEDLVEILKYICDAPKVDSNKPRIVVCTRDKNTTFVFTKDLVKEYPVIPIDETDIVDTNGAGDAFVGGFLSQMIQDKELDKCIEYGHKAAYIIIKSSGCTFPEHLDFDEAYSQISIAQENNNIIVQ